MSAPPKQSAIEELAGREDEYGRLARELCRIEAASQLTTGVVHDVRNALQVVLAEAEHLLRSLQDPELLDSANTVLFACRHAELACRDLLGLARKDLPRRSVIQGPELLTELQRSITRITQQRYQYEFDLAPDAWPIEVERQHLEAALLNLCVNARDAMPDSGLLRVRVHNAAQTDEVPEELVPGEYVVFEVEDTGIGMSDEVLARATEAFFTTKADRGTGLGLSMVNAFASQNHGALAIDSEVGRGTRVKLYLPRAESSHGISLVTPERERLLSRIRQRTRASWLGTVIDAWAANWPSDQLPTPTAIEAALYPHGDSAIVLAVDHAAKPAALRLVRMGQSLVSLLGGETLGDLHVDGSTAFGSLEGAYRRVLHSRFPSHEYLHFDIDPNTHHASGELERLILPTSLDGRTVSHLIGVILLSGSLATPHTEEVLVS